MTSNDFSLAPSAPPFIAAEPTAEVPATYSQLQLWTYRAAIYLALNFLDDPAWLAFMFC